MKSKLIPYDTENWVRVYQVILAHVDAKTCPAFSEAVEYINVRREQLEGRVWDAKNSISYRALVASQTKWPDEFLEKIIEDSKRSARYFDLLKEICANILEDGNTLSTPLAKWLSKHLRGQVERPRKESSTKNSERNFLICQFVEELKNLGFDKTRNTDGKNPTSGCDVVAEAYGVSFESIKSIYFNNNGKTPV